MALALQHMHAKNMAHMDVKPDNIYVLDETNYKLGDFGLAASSCSSKHGSYEEGDARYVMLNLFAFLCSMPNTCQLTMHSAQLFQQALQSWRGQFKIP